MRDRAHYQRMVDDNNSAIICHTLAARMGRLRAKR